MAPTRPAADPATLIDHNAARAIVEGRCADPFSHLGVHKKGNQYLLTVFQPGAERLDCLTGTKTVKPMQPLPDYPGLFVASFGRAPKYRQARLLSLGALFS